ncbi:MAG: hypothetical protein JXQ96_08970 [Cyclobacteriaceae bacterium]
MDSPEYIWKEKVVESLEGIKPAKPNSFLLTKIKNKIKHSDSSAEAEVIPLLYLRLTAAAILLLIVLNISVVRNSAGPSEDARSEAPLDMNAIGFSKNYKLYE